MKYELGGNGTPVAGKEQIISTVEGSLPSVPSAKPAALVACARLGIAAHLQNHTKYCATSSTFQHIRNTRKMGVREEHEREIRKLAMERLAELHPDEFVALVKEMEETLPDSS